VNAVFRIFGIDVRIHPSWLFVFVLVAWSLSAPGGLTGSLDIPPSQRVLLGLFTTVLFFASVLAHELAHSLLARSRGIPVRGITLMIFGGVSQFEQEPRTPPSATWISAIGPITSLCLGAVFYGIAAAFGKNSVLGLAFGYLSMANVLLGIFNFLPALPLDGGRVLQALIWRATGDRLRATQIAATISKVFSVLMIAFGFWEVAILRSFGGLWLAFIGWFLFQGAMAEETRARLERALQGHRVAELAVPSEHVVPADATVDRAARELANADGVPLPVVLDGRLLGMVSVPQVARAHEEHHDAAYVTSIMTRADDLPALSPNMRAIDALKPLAESNLGALPVIDENGRLYGIVSPNALMRWIADDRDDQVRHASGSLG
jgi:Zn-dependent protease/CBS domain-containing protein